MSGVFLGSISIGFVFCVVNMILIPLLNGYFSSDVSGLTISAGMLVAAIAGPFIGVWSDRIGRRLPFIGVLICIAFTGSLMLAGRNIAAVFAGGIMVAFCAYSLLGPYSSYVADSDVFERNDRNFGLVMGIVNVSGFAASLIVNRFLDRGFSITLLVLSAGIVIPFFFPVLSSMKARTEKPREYPQRINTVSIASIITRLALLPFFIMQFFAWFSLGGLFPYVTSFLSSETSMSLPAAAAWFGASTFLAGIVSFSTGIFVRVLNQKMLLLLSLSVMALLGLIYFLLYETLLKSPGAALIGIVTFVFSSTALGFFYSLSPAILSGLIAPDERGTIFGLNSTFMIVSQAISVGVMGRIIYSLGYRTMMLVCAGGFLIAAVSTSVIGINRGK